MTLLDNFQDVRGCVLDAKKFHSSISFNTPSDALISSLFIKYADSAGVPLSLFDDLLALLHHANFRVDGVTLYKSEDIMDRIADQRRLVAGNRNGMISYNEESKTLSSSYRPSSTLIPELVAEYVDSQRIPFHELIQIDRLGSNVLAYSEGLDVDNMLRAMSLVHRTWTDVAQRFLQRCITIFDYKILRYVLQSPRIGPWVRKLSFHFSSAEIIAKHIEAKEMSRLLCGILKKCPNITHLFLEDLDLQCTFGVSSGYPPSQLDKTTCDVINQISGLKCLEHLVVSRSDTWQDNPRDFSKLCAILPGLPLLKSLSVERWTGCSHMGSEVSNSVDEALNILGLADTTSPLGSLVSLSLVEVDIIISSLLTRLTEPDRGGRVTKLKLSMNDVFNRQHPYSSDRGGLTAYLRRSFTNGMRHITDLQLVQYGDPYLNPSDMESFLELFPSLQTLSLCQSLGYALPRKYFVLPTHIQHLHFHVMGVPKEEDPHALGILKANPLLRHMLITYSSQFWYVAREPPPPPLFSDTIEFCIRKRIEFVVTRVPTVPHFPLSR